MPSQFDIFTQFESGHTVGANLSEMVNLPEQRFFSKEDRGVLTVKDGKGNTLLHITHIITMAMYNDVCSYINKEPNPTRMGLLGCCG